MKSAPITQAQEFRRNFVREQIKGGGHAESKGNRHDVANV
jgi:hypothetical protein